MAISIESLDFINQNFCTAVAHQGRVLSTTDGGVNWIVHPLEIPYSFDGVAFYDVDEKDLMAAAAKTAEKIAELSPWAIQINKKAKIKASSLSKETFDEEQHRRIIARQAEDFKEAVKAFAEKRKPAFK